MIRVEDKRLIGTAAVASIVLLVAATIGGKDSRADVFVSSVGALGQVWIAVMLWHLAREQFAFTKSAAEREDRTSNYDRRAAVQTEWSRASLQIGYTGINEANVAALHGLLNKIEHLFGVSEKASAKEACEAASAARKRAREVASLGIKLNEDDAYRNEIDRFKAAQKATYEALKARTGIATE